MKTLVDTSVLMYAADPDAGGRRALIGTLCGAFEVVPVTPAIVREALRGVRDHRLSWFDAQMWAAAHLHEVPYLLTEDLAAGASYDGVTIVNPFAAPPPA